MEELIDELLEVEDKSNPVLNLTPSISDIIKVIETPNEVEFINS